MPLFFYLGRDSERGPELRKLHRDKHLAHIEPLSRAGRIHFAGPLLDADGNPGGSLILLEAADLAEAERIAENDPYKREGIFESVEVHGTRQVFPRDE
jgi:uncharacterized protein YciI